MNSGQEFNFEDDFLGTLIKSQEEAERLECRNVSDILVLKKLIFTPDTIVGEILEYVGVSWDTVKSSIENEVKFWAEETKKKSNLSKINKEDEDKKSTKLNENSKNVVLRFDQNMGVIIAKANAYAMQGQIIDELAFILALLDNPSNYVVSFFKAINLDCVVVMRYCEGLLLETSYEEFRDTIRFFMGDPDSYDEKIGKYADNQNNASSQENKNGTFAIPKSISGFVKVLEADDADVSPILGREEETERLIKVLLKSKKSNAILVGKPGVGKTAIVEDLAWRITKGKCPKELSDKIILKLDVNDIIAGTTLRGMAEERFKMISDFLANTNNIILFIDEIHNVIGAGSSGLGEKLDFANALKPILAREGVSVIGATTEEEYYNIVQRDSAFKRRFERINIREPKADEIYPMVKEQVNRLSTFHGVSITKSTINYIVKVSGCFIFETCNPDRTLDLIDKSMVAAKLVESKNVTPEIVISNFDANFKLYDKMSEEYKKSIAYHEAGHYIVARYGHTYSAKAQAVSIIPAENYLGITVYDDEEMFIEWDYKALLEKIAGMLGGRVAEEIFTGKVNSGASSDLEMATDEARKMLLKYGLLSRFSLRNSERDFHDERTKRLNEELDKIIGEAYTLAENTLKEHKTLLKEIVRALVKKGILVDEDLEKICKRVESRRVSINKTEAIVT